MTKLYIVDGEKIWLEELANAIRIEDIENQKYIKLKEGRVVSLFLKNLDLESIPSSVFKFNYLEKLYLNKNKLDTIPKEILNLKYLNVLSISHNLFKKLPEILGKLYSLKTLLFSYNPLKEIPNWIENLFQLNKISIGPLKKYKNLSKILEKLTQDYIDTDDEIWGSTLIIDKYIDGEKISKAEIKGIRALEKKTNRKIQIIYDWDEFESERIDMGIKIYENAIIALKVMNLRFESYKM